MNRASRNCLISTAVVDTANGALADEIGPRSIVPEEEDKKIKCHGAGLANSDAVERSP
jgi:hypothetical protein